MNLHFQYKEFAWLFLLVPIVVLFLALLLRWKRKTVRKIGDEKLVNALIEGYSRKLFIVKFILVFLALTFGVIAVMNPRKAGGTESAKRNGIDVVIALDVSKSMLAADMAPSRLERAKQFINRLITEMPDDRIALVLFAGKAYLQMPFTNDHGAARLFISSASPESVPQQGTVVSDALKMSAFAFNSEDKRYKAVVLISDGEDHDEASEKVARDLSEQGVMINTVGIGSPEGSTITDPQTGEIKTDATGNPVISKLNEQELVDIAKETNGVYTRLQNSDAAVETIQTHLAQIEKKAFSDIANLNFQTYYFLFAGAMFLLLFADNFIPERKKGSK